MLFLRCILYFFLRILLDRFLRSFLFHIIRKVLFQDFHKKNTQAVNIIGKVFRILKSLFPVLLLQFIEFIQFLLFLVVFSLAAFILLFCLYFFLRRMFPVANGIISVVCVIQRLVLNFVCNSQLGF